MRPSVDSVLMQTAWAWAQRGTCPRLRVGCVVAQGSRTVASGYNGAPPGLPHCVHERDEPCTLATHAEANALAFAARWGVKTEGATLYTTHSPCSTCAGLILAAGIERVVYDVEFRETTGLVRLSAAGVALSVVGFNEKET